MDQPETQQPQAQIDPQFVIQSLAEQRDTANNRAAELQAALLQNSAYIQQLQAKVQELSEENEELKKRKTGTRTKK